LSSSKHEGTTAYVLIGVDFPTLNHNF